ncbi:hypothetical protein KEM56_006607, partial [Ascosphaera pollenicola]
MLDSSSDIPHTQAGSNVSEAHPADANANAKMPTPHTVAAHVHGEPQIPPLEQVASLLYSQLEDFMSEKHEEGSLLQRVQAQTRISMRVIQEALQRHP